MAPGRLRFRLSLGLTAFNHLVWLGVCNTVMERFRPPNASPDAGLEYDKRHYVPAYPDHSAEYGLQLVLLGWAATLGLIAFFALRRSRPVAWGITLGWLPLAVVQALALVFNGLFG